MPPTSKFDRRKFFATAIAFIAGLLTPKPKLEAPELVTKGWAPDWIIAFRAEHAHRHGQAYCYIDNGHLCYVWPQPHVAFDVPQFHRHAFALTSEPMTQGEAFDHLDQMMDRWNADPFFPETQHSARIES
jgi:hypothetical protein